jgi:hypothetical protein
VQAESHIEEVLGVTDQKAESGDGKRKPYSPPAVKKLTLQDAKSTLEAKAIPGDKQGKLLLTEIRRRLRNKPRYVLFTVILLSMFAMPAVFLILALSNGPPGNTVVGHFTPLWVSLWAVLNIWIMLDANRLCGFVDLRPEPLSPVVLGVAGLGFVNSLAALLFLILTRRT